MVTQQIFDKASVWVVIVQGNVTGLFQQFLTVFFLKYEQAWDCPECKFWMVVFCMDSTT